MRPAPSADHCMLALDLVEPDPDNVRSSVGDVTELAESMRTTGLVQAIRVYPVDGGRYRIQAGHRRYAAALSLGWTEIRGDIGEPPTDDLSRLDAMLAENLHREQLNPLEEARAFRRYVDAELSQEEIARRVGRQQSHVSTTLMFLTELTDEEQQMLETGQLNRTTAVGLIKRRRAEQGRARADAGRKHQYGFSVPWFNRNHALADVAQERCRGLDHSPALRIGPACGPCWEHVILERAGAASAPAATAAPVPRPATDRPTPTTPLPRPPAPARFGDKHLPPRADTSPAPQPPPAAAAPTRKPGSARACGCHIPDEISDAVVARNPRVHEAGCETAADLELDRMMGRS